MKSYIRLLGLSTALCVAATAAIAGSNTVYLTQNGDGNSAGIAQVAGPGGNDFGLSGAPAVQQGNNNVISETQATGGGFSRGDNDVVALLQQGNTNSFSQGYSNNAGGNRILDFDQVGNNNIVGVTRNASIDGKIGTLLQQGNSNFMTVTQNGSRNEATLLRMLGSNNGWSTQPPGNGGSRYGMVISQGSGNDNLIREATINGSFNNANPGVLPGIRIVQTGSNNGRGSLNGGVGASTAIVNGTLSAIDILQQGNLNDFYVTQGVSTLSTTNKVLLTQIGNDNDATVNQAGDVNTVTISQTGNDNHLNVSQTNNNNIVTVTISNGNSNGTGTFSVAGAALATSKAISNGDIIQNGLTNNAELTITSSSLNKFAFLQSGNLNVIDLDVSGGNTNEAVVAQSGNSNTGMLTQNGNNNIITVTQ